MKRRLLRKPGLFLHTKIANVFMYADREVAISVVLPKLEIHTYQTNLGEGLILCGAKDAQKKKNYIVMRLKKSEKTLRMRQGLKM